MDDRAVTVGFGDYEEPWTLSLAVLLVAAGVAALLAHYMNGPRFVFEVVAAVAAGWGVRATLLRIPIWRRPDVVLGDETREELDGILSWRGSSVLGTRTALVAGSLTPAQRDDLLRALDAEIANRRARRVAPDDGWEDLMIKHLERVSKEIGPGRRPRSRRDREPLSAVGV